MNDARGLLEIAKTTGHVDIAAGHKLFTKKYLSKGRTVSFDSTHRVKIMKDGLFEHPFIFVAASEISGGNPDVAECGSESNALIVIEAILREAKK